jgi:hypothetical protein
MIRPVPDETVWIEYPEGKHVEAVYDAKADTFTPAEGEPVPASAIANWSRQEHEDTDISDDPKEAIKGKLSRN